MNSWHKILRVCTQTAICETYVHEQGAGQLTTVGLRALMEEHLELSPPQPLPQTSAIAQTIQQRVNQQVQKDFWSKEKTMN